MAGIVGAKSLSPKLLCLLHVVKMGPKDFDHENGLGCKRMAKAVTAKDSKNVRSEVGSANFDEVLDDGEMPLLKEGEEVVRRVEDVGDERAKLCGQLHSGDVEDAVDGGEDVVLGLDDASGDAARVGSRERHGGDRTKSFLVRSVVQRAGWGGVWVVYFWGMNQRRVPLNEWLG
jgi:hypothetical protein